MRYLLAVFLALWLIRPRWLQCPRPRGEIRAAIRLLTVSLAGFWGALRERWKRLLHGPGRHCCEPPEVLKISAEEIGMAWTLIPKNRVSGTPHEETLPGFAVPWLTARSA